MDMMTDFSTHEMEEYVKLVHLHKSFDSGLNFMCSLVESFGDILVIRALQKASSIPTTLRFLLLNPLRR